MNIMKKIREVLAVRSARKKGERAGADVADEIEANWLRFKELAQDQLDQPQAVYALFVGWMSAMHDFMDETFAAVEMPESESKSYWASIALSCCSRFRSEVLEPAYGQERAEEILTDDALLAIIADVDGVVTELEAEIESLEESARQLIANAERAADTNVVSFQQSTSTQQDESYYEQGREFWRTRASAIDIEKAIRAAPSQCHELIRAGMIDQMGEELREQEGLTPILIELMNAGPAMDQRLRLMFPDEQAFREFKEHVASEKANFIFVDWIKSAGRFSLAGLGGTAIGLAILGFGSLAGLYAFYVAGALLGAVLVPRPKEPSISGGSAVPLIAVLLIPLVLGVAVFAALLLLAEAASP